MSAHINILPIIAEWIRNHPDSTDFWPTRRDRLISFLIGRVPDDQIDLAADCLIAAGIGNEAEQQGTVYCRCTYGS
jgi:hypothetical protein